MVIWIYFRYLNCPFTTTRTACPFTATTTNTWLTTWSAPTDTSECLRSTSAASTSARETTADPSWRSARWTWWAWPAGAKAVEGETSPESIRTWPSTTTGSWTSPGRSHKDRNVCFNLANYIHFNHRSASWWGLNVVLGLRKCFRGHFPALQREKKRDRKFIPPKVSMEMQSALVE